MSKVKSIDLDEQNINFEFCSSQQFATVNFDRDEDSDKVLITIIQNGKIKQIDGDNKYNPSKRRSSSCAYLKEESNDSNIVKLCTIQHKGNTLFEIHKVSNEEFIYMFK